MELYGGTERQGRPSSPGASGWRTAARSARCSRRGDAGAATPTATTAAGRDRRDLLPARRRARRDLSLHRRRARTLAGGWESLGDIGYFDADGYLYLADRRTDMILVGGANVYPAEIEAALDEHPDVLSSAVVGLPDEDLGQRVHAIVQRREGRDARRRRAARPPGASGWCATRSRAASSSATSRCATTPARCAARRCATSACRNCRPAEGMRQPLRERGGWFCIATSVRFGPRSRRR